MHLTPEGKKDPLLSVYDGHRGIHFNNDVAVVLPEDAVLLARDPTGQIEAVILDSMPSETVVRFDLDQLYDYRSRRPHVKFSEDHFEDFEAPELNLHVVTDGLDRHFLLLTGPEPDTQWERFVAAVGLLV